MNRGEKRARRAELERASAKLKVMQQRFDRAAHAEGAKVGVPARISCRRGCHHCCHQFVPVTLAEANHIVLSYPAVVEECASELDRQGQKMLDMGIADADFMHLDRSRFVVDWFEARELCPFVDGATGDCRVYDARPHACRQHVLLDADPAICDPKNPPSSHPSWRPESALMQYVKESMPITLALSGGRIVLGPLQTVVLAVRDRLAKLGGG